MIALDEDRQNDGEAGAAFGPRRAQHEGRTKRDGGERVAGVVDEVGEQRDRAGGDVDRGLDRGGHPEQAKRGQHDAQAFAGALDCGVDEPVRVAVLGVVVVVMRDRGMVVRARGVVVGHALAGVLWRWRVRPASAKAPQPVA